MHPAGGLPLQPHRAGRGRAPLSGFVAVAVCIGTLASAAPRAVAADSVASLRREAARIEQQLEDTQDRLQALAEDRLDAREQLAGVRRDAAETADDRRSVEASIRARRATLVRRALSTYTGGTGSLSSVDFGLTLTAQVDRDVYQAVNTGFERDAVERLRAEQSDLEDRTRRLDRLEAEATRLQASLRAAEREMTALEARQERLLARAQGRLGAAIEEERRRRAAEEEARQRALVASRERSSRAAAAAAAEQARRRAATGRAGLSGRLRGQGGIAPGGSFATDEVPAAPGAGRAVQVALGQLGKPYIWGAEGPGGFDCSGLMLYAWRAAGRRLPRTSRAQWSGTRRVAIGDIRPGDLVFFAKPGRAIHHVGMYIGNGQMVEASRRGVPVRVRSIFRRDLLGAGRL